MKRYTFSLLNPDSNSTLCRVSVWAMSLSAALDTLQNVNSVLSVGDVFWVDGQVDRLDCHLEG